MKFGPEFRLQNQQPHAANNEHRGNNNRSPQGTSNKNPERFPIRAHARSFNFPNCLIRGNASRQFDRSPSEALFFSPLAMVLGPDHPLALPPNEIAEPKMPTHEPIVIRSSGTTNTVSTWFCSVSVAGFLLIAAINAHRSGVTAIPAAGLAAFFGAMLLYTATLRVELKGDEISYQHFFKRRRSLRLDQIRSARGTVRSTKGGPVSHLVIEPMDPGTPSMKMRMDFFSHADVQTIRNFFGDKLKRYTKKK
jgi:hypothetical protein